MSDPAQRLADRAAALRLAFDLSFAERQSPRAQPWEDLQAIGLGGTAHAIRLSEIDGLVADKPIVRVPTHAGALRGVAGFRGAIVPVYDLQTLLGYPMVETPRWLVIASGAALAFAFDAFDCHIRVSRDMILSREASDGSGQFVREVFADRDLTRYIVHLLAVVEAIKKLAGRNGPQRNDHV